ncbi:MAG: anhydro-N-acetylmuramic acid kinase, partial [Planctomycetota bacterium]
GLKLRVLSTYHEAFEPDIRARILALCKPDGGNSAEICELNFVLGEIFAHAAKNATQAAELAMRDIDFIGSHGQTIAHFPPGGIHAGLRQGSTLQIGEAAVIAERTGVPVVSNFRPRDMAAGGQGAPLVPYADWLLFSSETEHRIALNIGGIANITWMPAGGASDKILGFDTGPGNMILDALVDKISGGTLAYDKGGEMARAGSVNTTLLSTWLANPYFKRTPPKSTGREEFGSTFALAMYAEGLALGLSANDILATATQLTARSIAAEINRLVAGAPATIIAAGGGVRNDFLMDLLRNELPGIAIHPSDVFGLPSQSRECAAFALLARETMLGRQSNLPSATGARGLRVLGDITP